jgi:putative ABC transport system substrate-binding protein
VAKNPSKPIVFAMANDPFGLGLGKSLTDHNPNVTGAFLPHRLTLTVEIARGSLPKATKMAILFDPQNPLSVIHKDNLLKCRWDKVEPVEAPYGKNSDWAKLMDDLKAKGAEAVLLTNGLGSQSSKAIDEATRVKLSVWGTLEKQAEEGAIFTREPEMRWTGFEVGRRVGRIVNGEAAAKIPFAEGDHYVTVVNTKAGKEIGVTILPSIMRDIKDVSKPGAGDVGGVRQ